MAHEMAYQRAFWLVMGVLLAAPLSLGLGADPPEEGALGPSGTEAAEKPQPLPSVSARS